MTDEIDKHVLKKYEIQQKLGKGVRRQGPACLVQTDPDEYFLRA